MADNATVANVYHALAAGKGTDRQGGGEARASPVVALPTSRCPSDALSSEARKMIVTVASTEAILARSKGTDHAFLADGTVRRPCGFSQQGVGMGGELSGVQARTCNKATP
jgi:hypothetical protein